MIIKSKKLCGAYVGAFFKGFTSLEKNIFFIADIGCAEGNLLDYLNDLGFKKENLYGYDVSPQMVKKTKAKGYRSFLWDVTDSVKRPKQKFNLVFCLDVIEHVENPVKLLKNICYLLKPNGHLIISTPNINSLSHKVMKRNWYGYKDPTHQVFFNSYSLKYLIEKNGLQVKIKKTFSNTGWSFYNKLIGKTLWGGQSLILAYKK
jgi:2-polyprenyl-3-methyl-5-hydroxy-6-metoxy-1,4-benzoquinol methylase